MFTLDRNWFCQRSAFLEKKLEQAEARSSNPNKPALIEFKEHDPEDFATYVRCVHAGFLVLPEDKESLLPLLKLYVIANVLRDYTMANLAIDEIMRVSDETPILPTEEEITFVWEEVRVSEHLLRNLFVDYQIHEASPSSLSLYERQVPFGHPVDVTKGYSKLARKGGARGEAG